MYIGERGSKYQYKRVIIGPPAKRHLWDCLLNTAGRRFSEGIFEDVGSRYSANVCKKLYLAYTDWYGKYFFSYKFILYFRYQHLVDEGEERIQIPLKVGHHRCTSKTPFKWRFAGGPMLAQH